MPEIKEENTSFEGLKPKIDSFINELCQELKDTSSNLKQDKLEEDNLLNEVLVYSLSGGGKRIRPLIVSLLSEHFNLTSSSYKGFALALELVHTSSLIHDDLPCLDNDDFRRGKPSAHKQFDEASALLGGDALIALAYQLIVSKTKDLEGKGSVPEVLVALTSILSKAFFDVCNGQVLDISSTGNKEITEAEILNIHKLKTASLFSAAFVGPGVVAGLGKEKINAFKKLGEDFGFLFQLADDLDDFEEREGEGELNLVALIGQNEAKERLEIGKEEFLQGLEEGFGELLRERFESVFEILS